ncbi:MAG TPA: hypothetical protein VFR94_18115 [Nitrososphaeraceae archaeon]|nr:hypothetical protein [Nitrososphaeraceae archaeon]
MQNHAKNQSIKKIAPVAAVAFVATMLVGAFSFTTAYAAVTFNAADGTGFVGKGDVQTFFGWNNKQLQDNAGSVEFRAIVETENTWTCDRDAGPQTQERNNEVTSQQVVDTIARERNQVTGFNLEGFSGQPTVISSDGPATESCPTNWTPINLETNTGDAQLQISNGGSFQDFP